MTRRWYRERELTPFWDGITSDGTAYVTTSFEDGDRRHHLAAAFIRVDDLDNVAGAIARRAAQYPRSEAVSVDLYADATAGDDLAAEPARAGSRETCRCSCSACRPRRARADRGVSAADAITLHRSVDGGWSRS